MSYAVEISETAQSDIREIFRYIVLALHSDINASRQIQRIEEEIYSLSEMPERYPRYEQEPWFSRGLRMVTAGNYSIFIWWTKMQFCLCCARPLRQEMWNPH